MTDCWCRFCRRLRVLLAGAAEGAAVPAAARWPDQGGLFGFTRCHVHSRTCGQAQDPSVVVLVVPFFLLFVFLPQKQAVCAQTLQCCDDSPDFFPPPSTDESDECGLGVVVHVLWLISCSGFRTSCLLIATAIRAPASARCLLGGFLEASPESLDRRVTDVSQILGRILDVW